MLLRPAFFLLKILWHPLPEVPAYSPALLLQSSDLRKGFPDLERESLPFPSCKERGHEHRYRGRQMPLIPLAAAHHPDIPRHKYGSFPKEACGILKREIPWRCLRRVAYKVFEIWFWQTRQW